MKTVTATIDLAALDHNMQVVSAKANGAKVIAVVKANAYGHGAIECAKVMDKYVKAYAVARIEEAIELREANITKDIIMLGGFFSKDDLPLIEKYDISFAIHSKWQIEAIEDYKPKNQLKGWLQVNVGMERLGFNYDEIDEVIALLDKSNFIKKPIGMMSHLSCADSPATKIQNDKQLAKWKLFAKKCKGELSLTNSAELFSKDSIISDYIRPGIIQYGLSPFNEIKAQDLGLKPVMTLSSKIIKIRTLNPGDAVGYGASWVCSRPTKIAIIAIGYADGYPRAMPNGSEVLINNRICHTVGHVCMDMMFVDIGLNFEDKVGDEVILWGDRISADSLAQRVNTIGYELVTGLTSRVEYRYLNK